MEIIPVIDLMNGVAVLAQQGQRQHYRPLSTPLCRSSDPRAVLKALLNLQPFRTVYLADLDALMGRGNQWALIDSLKSRYPELEFWVDAGIPAREEAWVPVVGTESLDAPSWERLTAMPGEWILSLDCLGDQLQGAHEIWEQVHLWPQRIIVMNLQQVGSFDGPDWNRLARTLRLAGERDVIAAGGIRNLDDLRRLDKMGIHTALVASALHSGSLRPAEIMAVGREQR